MNVNILDILTFAAATTAFLYAMRNARANETLADMLTRLASAFEHRTSATDDLQTAVQHQTTGLNEQQASFDRLRESIAAMADKGGDADSAGLRAIADHVDAIRNDAAEHDKELADQLAGIATALKTAIEGMATHHSGIAERLDSIQRTAQAIRNQMDGTLLETQQALRTGTAKLAEDLGNRINGVEAAVEKLRKDLPKRGGAAARNKADKKDRDKAPRTTTRRRTGNRNAQAGPATPTPAEESDQTPPGGTPRAADEPPAGTDPTTGEAEDGRPQAADEAGEDSETHAADRTAAPEPDADATGATEEEQPPAGETAEPAPQTGETTGAPDSADAPATSEAAETADGSAQSEDNDVTEDTPQSQPADTATDATDDAVQANEDNAQEAAATGHTLEAADGNGGAADTGDTPEQGHGNTSLPAGDQAQDENAPVTDPAADADEEQPQGATAQAGAAETERAQ